MTHSRTNNNVGPKSIYLNCSVCGSNNTHNIFYIAPRQIVGCNVCGHEYVNPIPDPKSLPEYFFQAEEDTIGTKIDIEYLKKVFSKYGLMGRLLDVGCGQGRLEKGFIGLGWKEEDLFLMDLSERNIAITQKKYPSCNSFVGDVEKDLDFFNYFDIIIATELLEDLPNPKRAMKNLLDALKQEGILLIRGIPNNASLEAFIGLDKWMMRQFIHHFNFFNAKTFLRFASQFPNAEVLEFGTFLQEGYNFYNLARVARDIGIISRPTDEKRYVTLDGETVETSGLFRLVSEKIGSTNLETYSYRERIPKKSLDSFSSISGLEGLFDNLFLDPNLAPDFSVVIRRREK